VIYRLSGIKIPSFLVRFTLRLQLLLFSSISLFSVLWNLKCFKFNTANKKTLTSVLRYGFIIVYCVTFNSWSILGSKIAYTHSVMSTNTKSVSYVRLKIIVCERQARGIFNTVSWWCFRWTCLIRCALDLINWRQSSYWCWIAPGQWYRSVCCLRYLEGTNSVWIRCKECIFIYLI